jgi:hypothetical protein
MDVCLASARIDGWILFISDILEFIHHIMAYSEDEHSSSKNRDSLHGPTKHKIIIF